MIGNSFQTDPIITNIFLRTLSNLRVFIRNLVKWHPKNDFPADNHECFSTGPLYTTPNFQDIPLKPLDPVNSLIASEKEIEKASKKGIKRTNKNASEKASEKKIEKMIEKALENTIKKKIENASEKASEKVIVKASEKAIKKTSQKASEKIIEKVIKSASEKGIDITNKNGNKRASKKSNENGHV